MGVSVAEGVGVSAALLGSLPVCAEAGVARLDPAITASVSARAMTAVKAVLVKPALKHVDGVRFVMLMGLALRSIPDLRFTSVSDRRSTYGLRLLMHAV